MVYLGFCRPCFSAGKGRVDAARMHRGEALCPACLKAAGVEMIAPPSPVVRVQAPLRRVVAKAPADAPLVKTLVSDQPCRPGVTTVKMLPALHGKLCSRGCGKPTHRGLCAGQGSRNYAAAVGRVLTPCEAVTSTQIGEMVAHVVAEVDRLVEEIGGEGLRMDRLIAEYVREEDVPGKAQPVRKPTGRMGELWLMLERAPADRPRVKVRCNDVPHAGYTSRHLRKKAERAGREVVIQREGSDLYCWFAESAAWA